MKQFYFLAAALFIVHGVLAQWVMQNSGTKNKLNSVVFTDSVTGYVVGNEGVILKTNNGGETWSPLNSGTANSLLSVCFSDSCTGYVVGSNGTILKTVNAGEEWTSQVSGISRPLYSVFFVNNDTGYAVGGGGVTARDAVRLKTTDGGTTWNVRDSVGFSYLKSVFFTSPDTGYIASGLNWFHGSIGTIQKTTNGGQSWPIVFEDFSMTENVALNAVFFSDSKTGYMAGCGGIIRKMGPHDTIWKYQNTETWRELLSIYVVRGINGVNMGYAVGQGGVIQKTEGLDSIWLSQVSGTENDLNSVVFTDYNHGYAVGDSGTILVTNNGGEMDLNEIQNDDSPLKIWPNPASGDITLESWPSLNGAIVTILNLRGQELLFKKLVHDKTQLDIGSFPPGIYFVKVKNERTAIIKKLIKE